MKKLLYILLLVPFALFGQTTPNLDLPQGWSLFGYVSPEELDVENAFSEISDKITIVKNENGGVYMPEFSYNGMGNLMFAKGYQIKMTEQVDSFQFFTVIATNIDSLIEENEWLQTELDSLQTELDSIYGCIDESACNYDFSAVLGDNSCEYPDFGFNCFGNEVQYEIGDIALGGIIFYVDSTGQHGLVAAIEDVGQFEWGCYGENVVGADETSIGAGYQNTLEIESQGCQTENDGINAAQAALAYEYGDYTDWYLPSKGELLEMFYTIGNGGNNGNLGNFIIIGSGLEGYKAYYWSSSEQQGSSSWSVRFTSGGIVGYGKYQLLSVRPIRSF